MRNYLLGSLEAERRMALEESILCDAEIYEELLVVEEELIDQYITNNLSPSERQQFETNFLITPERQRNLRFGRLLRRYLDSQPDPDDIHAPAHGLLPPHPGTFARSVTLGVSAAVVVIVVILTLICWRSNRTIQQQTVQQNSSTPVSYTLTPGSLRSEDAVPPRVVKIPPKGVNVRLAMEVGNTHFRNYKSELFRENESLQTADELKAEPQGEQHVVPWTIAGDVLSPGDYQIKLSGVADSGPDAFIDNYSFRVTKK